MALFYSLSLFQVKEMRHDVPNSCLITLCHLKELMIEQIWGLPKLDVIYVRLTVPLFYSVFLFQVKEMRHDVPNSCLITLCHLKELMIVQIWGLPQLDDMYEVYSVPLSG